MLGFVLDNVFLAHTAPDGHPERPARLVAVRDALIAHDLPGRARLVPVRAAELHELGRVHDAGYLDDLTRLVPGQQGWLDADTYFSPGTWTATLAAAGGLVDLTTRVMSGELSAGLAIVRPPGHHATRARGMGFCLVNNIAVAAAAARAGGAARVAIVDWDVHHGNGTQDIFWDDPTVLYASVHQHPYYPGTGSPLEVGGPAARGATVNIGLAAGAGDADYLAAFTQVIVPALRRFRPDVILVSAGFDAHHHDPLAGMRVTPTGFAAMARCLRIEAAALCGGRLVVGLEGGYDLDGLAASTVAVTEELLRPVGDVALAGAPAMLEAATRAAIHDTLRAHEGPA